jgi:hypothetical protein
MKTEKKHVGTKAEIRSLKERERRIATAIFLALILLVVAFSAYFTYLFLNQPPDQSSIEPTLQFKPENLDPQLKAAIVDHLSLTAPNQTFVQTAATILTKANYTVDYFSGEKVTVNFFRNLPSGGYTLIVLRVHSALGTNNAPPLALFTSEPLDSRKYVNEQLTDQLQGVVFLPYRPGDKYYFGIPPKFIKLSMKGELSNSVIIAMGCDGLAYTDMAQAFIEKRAKAYISWNGSVLASHTDQATIHLLQNLVIDNQTIKQAVETVMKEVGLDLEYNSQLTYYPLEVGEQTIENIKR